MGNPALNIVGGTKDVVDEELRLWLKKYIADHPHLNTNILARSDHTGASRAALDGYIAGTYFLPVEQGGAGVNPAKSKLEQKIRDYREKVEGVVRGGVKNAYLPTRLWQQFQFMVKTAIEERAIVVGYGSPGVGKSRALNQYKTEKMTTMPIEILCSPNITTRYFVQKLAAELKLDDRFTTAKLEDLIADKLKKGTPRPLFVDQANYLNEKGLGTICYLWERARVPIILLGTTDLFNLFMESSLTEDVRVQLTSRIAWHCALVELSIEELKSIVYTMLGSKYATNAVVKQIYDVTGGKHRHLEMALPRIAKIIEKNKSGLETGEVLIDELVQKGAKRLMIG